MNIDFGKKYEPFREEIRQFLDDNLTDELRDAQRFCPGIFSITNTTLNGTKFYLSKVGSLPHGLRNMAEQAGI